MSTPFKLIQSLKHGVLCSRLLGRVHYLLLIMLFSALSAHSQDNLNFFLRALNQNSLDSTKKIEHRYATGILRERILVSYSHYYQFDVHHDRYLKRTFIKVREHYNSKGILVRKDSLAPPEQELYCEKFFDQNGLVKKVITYAPRLSHGVFPSEEAVLPPADFEKRSEYVITPDGKRNFTYLRKEPLKYRVERNGSKYHFTSDLYDDEIHKYADAKYAIFQPTKKYLKIDIKDPLNDSTVCTLKFDYRNPFLESRDAKVIKAFIIKYANVFVRVPALTLFDDRTKKSFILNYNFEKVFKEPFDKVQLLQPASGVASYYWLCNEKCGLYDLSGKNVIPSQHHLVYPKGDFLKIETDKRYACFDYRGNIVIPYTKSYDAFSLSANNIAQIYVREYFPTRSGVLYVDLVRRDTIKVDSGLPFNNGFAVAQDDRHIGIMNAHHEWVVKPNLLVNDVKLTSDKMAFIEIKNKKFYGIYGPDKRYWYERCVLKLADSLQHKTDLYSRHPDFEPTEYKYVLYNLETGKADTLNAMVHALQGNPGYSLSLESNAFVNGYAKIRISALDQKMKWFYTLVSKTGTIVDVQTPYNEIKEVNDAGQSIVKCKKYIPEYKREREFEGVITNSGEEVIPCEYYSCSLSRYGYFVYKGGDNWGLIDFDGQTLIKPESKYNDIESAIRKANNPFLISFTVNLK